MKEEPQYQVFDYKCPHCGHKHREASSVKKHPDHQVCPKCGKKGIMEAKDTVEAILKESNRLARNLANDTEGNFKSEDMKAIQFDGFMEIYKAGRREVVEWMNENVGYNGMTTLDEKWQAQLKVWFKDNPELLKEWGIK